MNIFCEFSNLEEWFQGESFTNATPPSDISPLTPGIYTMDNPETTVIFLSITIALALACRLFMDNLVPWLSIPTTVPLIAAGIAFGFFASEPKYKELHMFYKPCNLSSKAMMYLLLPGLTFDLCFKAQPHIFKKCFFQVTWTYF